MHDLIDNYRFFISMQRAGSSMQRAARDVEAGHAVRHRNTLMNGDNGRDARARVNYNTGPATTGEEREHPGGDDAHGRHVERLEHYLRHLLSISLWSERCLRH